MCVCPSHAHAYFKIKPKLIALIKKNSQSERGVFSFLAKPCVFFSPVVVVTVVAMLKFQLSWWCRS